MPEVTLYDSSGNSYTGEDGCFCFLGKDWDYKSSMIDVLDNSGVSDITSMTFHASEQVGEDWGTVQELLEFQAKIHPFFRCSLDPVETILETGDVQVDAENYSFNEIQHLFWHVRAAGSHKLGLYFSEFRNKGFSEEASYVGALIKFRFRNYSLRRSSSLGFLESLFECYGAGDEDLYRYRGLSVQSLFNVLSGGYVPRYLGGTYQEFLDDNSTGYYPKNLSLFATDIPSESEEEDCDGDVEISFEDSEDSVQHYFSSGIYRALKSIEGGSDSPGYKSVFGIPSQGPQEDCLSGEERDQVIVNFLKEVQEDYDKFKSKKKEAA